jgi:hypothetical protein
MDTVNRAVWPKSYTQLSLIFTFVLVSLLMIFFFRLFMPMPIFVFGLAVIIFFFVGLDNYSFRWQNLNEKDFTKRLFWHSFLYRVIFVVCLYLLTLWLDPNSFPFEINAADSWTYHIQAIEISKNLYNGQFFQTLHALIRSQDDFGFPTYLGVVYSFFGYGANAFAVSIPVRLLNCLWGSLTVIYICKIARMVYSDEQARIAGVIAMLMPAFLWFGGMHLKETLMLFLIVLIFYHAIKMVYIKRINIISIFLVIMLSLLLFFFRTYLAGLVVGCVAFYFLLNFTKKKATIPVAFVVFILFVAVEYYLVKHFGFQQRFSQNLSLANINELQRQLTYNAGRVGVSFKATSVTPFVFLGGILTPFPSFLNLDPNQLGIFTSYQNELVRNVMYFFAFSGILFSLRTKFRNISLLLIFSLGNTLASAMAGFSVYDRYQLPSLPFFVIFMAEGIKHSNNKTDRVWVIYLLVVMAAIFAWNIFKVHIRGMI